MIAEEGTPNARKLWRDRDLEFYGEFEHVPTDHLDILVLWLATIGAVVGLFVWSARLRTARRTVTVAAALMALTLVVGTRLVEWEDQDARSGLRASIQGVAPTYAAEMRVRGHARLATNAAADDPLYLELIEAEKRWLSTNESVADIYTVRRDTEGRWRFIVDSETDYNRNGTIDEEREERTSIGEVVESAIDEINSAAKGTPYFQDQPETDRWGTWVSAYVPIYDETGGVEAVLGVDFPASAWASTIARARLGMIGYVTVILVILGGGTVQLVVKQRHIQQIKQLQAEAVAISRRAGMAEVAAGVLHNVGNAMTNVNILTESLATKVSRSKASNLSKVSALLAENEQDLAGFFGPGGKGRLLPGYIAELAGHVNAELAEVQSDLSGLRDGLQNIRSIVASHQGIASSGCYVEPVDLRELAAASVTLLQASLDRHGVSIDFDIEPRIAASCDRSKLSQVLVNLMTNAKQALVEAGTPGPRILVRAGRGAAERVFIEVCDNGPGITPEHREKLFSKGFTTKPGGHGIGLHYCWLALREMDGSLDIVTEHEGPGATFRLELPSTTNVKDAVS